MAINVASDAIEIICRPNQPVVSHTPPDVRDKDLDLTFYFYIPEGEGLTVEILGEWGNVSATDTIIPLTATMRGTYVEGVLKTGLIAITIAPEEPLFTSELSRSNWVKWSNIGSLDFAIWKDNVAGERPLDWKGWIYAVKKLTDKMVVYGEGGVSVLKAKEVNWGMLSLYTPGVKSRLAVCGTDSLHLFVDTLGRLCRLTDAKGMEVLGYEEWLDSMTPSLSMCFDDRYGLAYICDGAVGYVYNDALKSMGRGPANVSGFGRQSGLAYFVSPGTIENPLFDICTDIYDLGSRKDKTVIDVEFGVNAAATLYAAIDWRKDKTVAFQTTPWTRVNPNGKANLPCYGREFRLRLRAYASERFDLDYIKVVGQLHNYSFLDSFLRGRQV